MTTNSKPIYKRILLKLSGEALQGFESFGIKVSILDNISKKIKRLVELGIQVGMVIGGGNFFRGTKLEKEGINRVVGDHIGMLATVMNGLIMRDILHRACIKVCLMSAIPLNGICEHYSWIKAINLLSNNCVVIFSSGIGNPFFTTDSTACLRGIEMEVDAVLKATKVDGVFTADPTKDPSSIMYDQVSYDTVLEKELQVMDRVAFTLARDHKLPIHVFNINKSDALYRVVMGKKEGTLITG